MRSHALVVLLAMLALGCSYIVDPNAAPMRCELAAGEQDPCPTDYACLDGKCKKIECKERDECGDGHDDDCDGKFDEGDGTELDACDGIDNDCDGTVDEQPEGTPELCGDGIDNDCDGKEDEGHDSDGDDFTWCGNTADGMMGGPTKDCDDLDALAFPNGQEICDGRDNNCDGTVDEAVPFFPLCGTGLECVGQRCVVPSCSIPGSSKACPEDLMCNAQTGTCDPRGCTPDSCPGGEYCDQTSGECRETRRPNGEICLADADCLSNTCVDALALRLRGDAARVCGEACCGDSDCGEGERCFVAGSGARSCLPFTIAPAPSNSRTQCLQDDQCQFAQVCAIVEDQPLGLPARPRDDLTAPACRFPEGGERPPGANCDSPNDCITGTCVPGPLFVGICSNPCRTSADCDDTVITDSYCRFMQRGEDFFPVCVTTALGSNRPGEFGAACSSGADCQDGACYGATNEQQGICTQACCRDVDCIPLPGNGAPTHCRPVAYGDHYEMRCVP